MRAGIVVTVTRMSSELSDGEPLLSRARKLGGLTWFGLILATPLCLGLLLEVGLRAVHVGYPAGILIPDTAPGVYRTNPHFAELFFTGAVAVKPQNFRLPQKKPAGATRVFVLGESAAVGLPEPGFGLTAQLRAQLRSAFPGKSIEVYNLAVPGLDSHLVRLIAHDLEPFGPDALVVYLGNNEVVGPYGPGAPGSGRISPLWWIRTQLWFETTRVGQLLRRIADKVMPGASVDRDWPELELHAGAPIPTGDARLARVRQYFSANLHDILSSADKAGAKVILSTVAVNIRGCAPFASPHSSTLSETDLIECQRLTSQAIDAVELDHPSEARELFERALALDPTHAETHFRLGLLLLHGGDAAAAQSHFLAALQHDGLRFRATDAINDVIRRTAKAAGASVRLVDAASALGESGAKQEAAPLFLDHVHLSWEGNDALGRLIGPALATTLIGQEPSSEHWLGPDSCATRVGFTAAGRLSMLLRLEGPTAQPPFTAQYTFAADRMRWQKAVAAATAAVNSAAVLRSAAITIETALEDDPDNAFLVQQAAALNSQLKATQHALELNERLPKLRPPCADDLTQRAFLLLSAGRLSEAEAPLLTAAQLEPGNTETYALLAQLWLMNQQFGRAQTFFGALVAKMPEHGGLRLVYADVLAANGEWTAAEAQWNAVLVRTPANEAALKPLVQRLLARKANDTAQDLMLKAFAANPRSFANNERLLQLYGERGDRAKVVELMRALADSGPVSPVLHADLGQLLVEFGQKHEARLEFIRARRLAETLKDTDVAKRADAAIRDYPLENQ